MGVENQWVKQILTLSKTEIQRRRVKNIFEILRKLLEINERFFSVCRGLSLIRQPGIPPGQ